eukprot:scaffold251294_cov29-Prasinocladus_malaysianus.AAC.1
MRLQMIYAPGWQLGRGRVSNSGRSQKLNARLTRNYGLPWEFFLSPSTPVITAAAGISRQHPARHQIWTSRIRW